jgi:hypothetical protein
MDNILDINKRIATIVDAVEEAFISMGAAMRFAEYLFEDSDGNKAEERTPKNIHKLEVELPDTLAWITVAITNLSLLKKELEGQ